MLRNTLILATLALTGAYAQTSSPARTTYTGCSTETIDGQAVYGCFGPNGSRTPFSTIAVSTPAITAASVSATATATGQTTAVTSCTALATDDVQCLNGAGSTVRVEYTPTATEDVPAQFTGCHEHDGEGLFCFSPDGEDVAVVALGQTTAVTSCTATATNDVRCVNGAGSTVQVMHTPTATEDVPAQYTGCHSHGADETFCFSPEGEDVAVVALGAGSSSSSSSGSSERSCHFHGPVEHCVGGDESEAEEARDCGMSDYSYNISLRVGMIFVVLVTSGIGVYAPILISKLPLGGKTIGNALQMLKQFGTGIIISTAFIHLYSHAELYLSNQCIRWPVYYEGTTSAIVMAGLFISFLIDFIAHRYVGSRTRSTSTTNPDGASATSSTESPSHDPKAATHQPPNNPLLMFDHHSHGNGNGSSPDNDKLSVTLMEVGIVFHSILIGLTLSVTPDQAFRTLLVVIIFHQFFEGLALGARISLLPNTSIFPRKFLMAAAFALITPIGMAIGLGVVHSFNGNDPSTMITFGTLNALSAGILIWVGVVDMWARDWVIEGGEMLKTSTARTAVAMVFFVSGLVLMSVLGKWA